jgi:hypothetical protein
LTTSKHKLLQKEGMLAPLEQKGWRHSWLGYHVSHSFEGPKFETQQRIIFQKGVRFKKLFSVRIESHFPSMINPELRRTNMLKSSCMLVVHLILWLKLIQTLIPA